MEPTWNIPPPIRVEGENVSRAYARNALVRQAIAYVVNDLAPEEGWVNSTKVNDRLRELLGWQRAKVRMVGGIIAHTVRCTDPILASRGYSPNLEYRLTDLGRECLEGVEDVVVAQEDRSSTEADEVFVDNLLRSIKTQIIHYAEGNWKVTEPVRKELAKRLLGWRSKRD